MIYKIDVPDWDVENPTRVTRSREYRFRIGRGDGSWESYPVERVLKFKEDGVYSFVTQEIIDAELAAYGGMLANMYQAIIRCEADGTPPLIFSPSKWIKKK